MPAALATAMLLNPYGARVFAVTTGITGALSELSAINPEWLPVWRAPQPMIFAMLFAGFAALAALVAETAARTRRVHLPTGIVAAGLAALALTAVRHQALFFVTGAFFAAETLALRRSARESHEHDRPANAAPAGPRRGELRLPAARRLVSPSSRERTARAAAGRFELSRGIAPHRFPVAAANWLEQHPGIGPLYNELAHGGYLLWRLYPPRQVFLDGRMELEPNLLREIEAARSGAERWQRFRRAARRGALVRYEDRLRPVFATDPSPASRSSSPARRPTLRSFRGALGAGLLGRRGDALPRPGAGGESTPFLANEYAIQPEDTAATLVRAGDDPQYRVQALADVERRLAEAPALRRAAWLRDRLRALGASRCRDR